MLLSSLLPVFVVAAMGLAVVLSTARGDVARIAGWMLTGGWFLFALTSPTTQFPVVLRPVGLVVAAMGVALVRIARDGDPVRRTGSASVPVRLLFVFAVCVLLGCFSSPDGASNLVRGIQGVLIIGIALYGVSLGYRARLVGGVLVAAFINVGLTIISGAPEVVPGVHGAPERLSGFMQPNHLAFAAAVVLIGVAALWGGHRQYRIPLLVVAGISTYALLASRSRTGLLAVIISLAVAGAASVKPAARIRALAITLFVALALVPLAGPVGQSWFDRDSDDAGSGVASLTGRTDLWPPIVDLIQERPIVGWGVDAVPGPAGVKVQDVLPGVSQAHNAYLEAALMGGLPGAVAWGLSLATVLFGSWRLPRGEPWRFGLIATAILLQLYAITESSPAWFGDMFICFVLVVAVHSEARAALAATVTRKPRVSRAAVPAVQTPLAPQGAT